MIGYADEADLGNLVETIPMLDERECDELRREVYELQPHWVQRLPGLPMYSLGAALYLDAAHALHNGGQPGERMYVAIAAKYNPILLQHFAPLYRRLEEVLSKRLGGPVAFPPDKALPGFHVFLAHPAFTQMTASVHADLQYQLTDWSWARSVSRPFSFTVAISLPQQGGGLNVWDITVRQWGLLPPEQLSHALRQSGPRYFAYQRGHLALQCGHLMHQIATPKRLVDGDDRLTFQGHGLLCDGIWQLYW
jgi:hypothetical protein